MSAKLIETIDGNGFPNVYVYEFQGTLFGVSKTWRSSPAGWNVSERTPDGKWGEWLGFEDTRKAAIAVAESEIAWRNRPAVTEQELSRLIAEDWDRTAGR